MIIGIGNDLVDIRRIERLLHHYGRRFVERVFTKSEQERALQAHDQARSLAKRFAAKEAAMKALGTGLSNLKWIEVSVDNLQSGQPTLIFSGKAKKQLKKLIPSGFVPKIHISLSDELYFAFAVVIISAQKDY